MIIVEEVVPQVPLRLQVVFFVCLLDPPRAEDGEHGHGAQVVVHQDAAEAVVEPLLVDTKDLRGGVSIVHQLV